MRRKVSQDEAHETLRRVRHLEALIDKMRANWATEYPEGVHVGTIEKPGDVIVAIVHTARRLGHAVVLTERGNDLEVFALPVPKGEDA